MTEHDRDQEAMERELSALYRKLEADEPPPALDAAVLRAAREEAGGGKSAFTSRAGLSIAASVMLVTMSVLLFGDPDERARDEAVATFAPAAADVQVQSASAEQGRLEDSAVQGLAPGPLVEPTRARAQEELQRNIVIMRAPEGGAPEQELAEPPATATAGANRSPPIARSAGTLSDRGVPERTAAGDQQQASSLEQLLRLVEQARLTETPEQRERRTSREQEAWLAEIRVLLEEDRLVEAYNELELFRNAFPEVEVEAALALPPALRE